nr:uncharacterized HTH-type transcriptional regulator YhcF-like [Nerophis lumbriciformis]
MPSPDLPVEIDRSSGIPIYIQLEEQIRLRIRRGQLLPGTALPTVRSLAVELGINANTVARVYRDLQREGLLRLERGVGTFVTEASAEQAVEPGRLDEIANAARRLVELGRSAGLRPAELARLIETLWKETVNAER